MQNNLEFAQASSSADGTHVGHDVPTCMLHYMVSGNRLMVLQYIFYPRCSLHHKIYKSWRRVYLDVLVQHVEHDVPACVAQHLAFFNRPWWMLLRVIFLIGFQSYFCCRSVRNLCLICLTTRDVQNRFKRRFKFEFEI